MSGSFGEDQGGFHVKSRSEDGKYIVSASVTQSLRPDHSSKRDEQPTELLKHAAVCTWPCSHEVVECHLKNYGIITSPYEFDTVGYLCQGQDFFASRDCGILQLLEYHRVIVKVSNLENSTVTCQY